MFTRTKRSVSLIIAFMMMFALTVNVTPTYASAKANDLDLMFQFIDSEEGWGYYPAFTDEVMEQAQTNSGATITVPYGYITEIDSEANTVYILATISEDSDIEHISLEYDEEYGDYSDDIVIADYIDDGQFVYKIEATMNNGDNRTYTFRFTEDNGELLDVGWLSVEFYDENGNADNIKLIEEGDGDSGQSLENFKEGLTVELPYYYDNSKGFNVYYRGFNCIINDNIEDKYFLDDGKLETVWTFTSANGSKVVNIPITVYQDTVGDKIELKSIGVNCYEYYDSDDSYVDEWFYADLTSICNNEIYIMIPSYYECKYSKDDSFCEYVDIDYVTKIALFAEAKNGARFKTTSTDEDGTWEEMSSALSMDLEDFQYTGTESQDVELQLYSANNKLVETYTIKVIVSDCDGYHNFSTWKTVEEASCTKEGLKMHKCTYCPYIEYKTIDLSGHTEVIDKAVPSTCTTLGKTEGKHCSVCGEFLVAQNDIPALGHNYGSQVTEKPTLTKDGMTYKTCSVCDEIEVLNTVYYPKTIKLSKDNFTYNGKTRKPTVTVKDSAGNVISKSNYSVKYAKGRKNIGKYKVTVTFNNKKYTGTKNLYFTISPSPTKLKSVSSPKNGAIKVNWSKKSKITGYQIRYSKNSNMENSVIKTVKGKNNSSKTITGLTKGKKYYVQVRTYKTVNGVKCCSDWSSKKSITVKNIRLNKTNVQLKKGKSIDLNILGTSQKVKWSSSNKSVATVNSKGLVTGKKTGNATITAKVGGVKYTCKVKVYVPQFGSVSGNITYYYNDFWGSRADVGADVFLIPTDGTAKNMPTLSSYIYWDGSLINKQGNNYKVYGVEVDGTGAYTLQNIPTGKYLIYVISNETTSGSAFDNEEAYINNIADLVAPYLNETNANYLGEMTVYNKYTFGTITIKNNQNTVFSHDFGITYI